MVEPADGTHFVLVTSHGERIHLKAADAETASNWVSVQTSIVCALSDEVEAASNYQRSSSAESMSREQTGAAEKPTSKRSLLKSLSWASMKQTHASPKPPKYAYRNSPQTTTVEMKAPLVEARVETREQAFGRDDDASPGRCADAGGRCLEPARACFAAVFAFGGAEGD